jgi:hypothetical protein
MPPLANLTSAATNHFASASTVNLGNTNFSANGAPTTNISPSTTVTQPPPTSYYLLTIPSPGGATITTGTLSPIAANLSATGSIVVPSPVAKEPESRVKKGIEFMSGLQLTLGIAAASTALVAGWKTWWGPFINARNLGKGCIKDWGIPKKGSYRCAGNPASDAAISELIAEAKTILKNGERKAPDILIQGSTDVGRVWPGKGIAAELGWPVLHINCAQLATPGEIPERFVKVLEKRVEETRSKYGTDGVVVILEDIDGFFCSRQDKFTRKLASRLLSDSSPLQKHAVVVGTLNTDSPAANKKEGVEHELLTIMRAALPRELSLIAPQNANETARLVGFKLQDKIRRTFSTPDYELSPVDTETLQLLARALPHLKSDTLARQLAASVTGEMTTIKTPLREILIRKALDQIVGAPATHASWPKARKVHASQVICEGLVARALDLGVLALCVQTRREDAYVCRERLSDCKGDGKFKGEDVGTLLKEMVTSWARYLGTKKPYNSCIESVDIHESDLQTRLLPIAKRLAEVLLVERERELEQKEMNRLSSNILRSARRTAEKILTSLSTGDNAEAFIDINHKFASGDEDSNTGRELCCGELETALNAFDLTEAIKHFDKFKAKPDSIT